MFIGEGRVEHRLDCLQFGAVAGQVDELELQPQNVCRFPSMRSAMSRVLPSHVCLCFNVGLSSEFTEALISKVVAQYASPMEFGDFRPSRLGKSVSYFPPDDERARAVAATAQRVVDGIHAALRPFVAAGYFSASRGSNGLARLDLLTIAGLPCGPDEAAVRWRQENRVWGDALGLQWLGAHHQSNDYALMPSSTGGASWKLVLRRMPDEDGVHEREETFAGLVPSLSVLTTVVALHAFADVESRLLANFRKAVNRALRGSFTWFFISGHSKRYLSVVSTKVLVEGMRVSLARGATALRRDEILAAADLLVFGNRSERESDPFIGFLLQRFTLIAEGLDSASKFFADVLSTQNLRATYFLSLTILFVTILGTVGFESLRQGLSQSWAAISVFNSHSANRPAPSVAPSATSRLTTSAKPQTSKPGSEGKSHAGAPRGGPSSGRQP
jgi:hypothetical protein